MLTLSTRQPFAWLIVAGLKPIENRSWTTKHRGPLRIHASTKLHDTPIEDIERQYGVIIDRDALKFGGVIGCVDLVDVITESTSIWFHGPYGFVLERPRALPFIAMRGNSHFFNS